MHQVAPAEGDSWCLGCSSGEALTKELAGHWASAGARTLAEDLILSTVRQVRFLRNLTQGIQSNQRASAQAVSQRAKGEPPRGQNLPESARPRPQRRTTRLLPRARQTRTLRRSPPCTTRRSRLRKRRQNQRLRIRGRWETERVVPQSRLGHHRAAAPHRLVDVTPTGRDIKEGKQTESQVPSFSQTPSSSRS